MLEKWVKKYQTKHKRGVENHQGVRGCQQNGENAVVEIIGKRECNFGG